MVARRGKRCPAVLGVKPAFEEDDAQVFLAFHCATVEVKIESNSLHAWRPRGYRPVGHVPSVSAVSSRVGESRAKASQRLADER